MTTTLFDLGFASERVRSERFGAPSPGGTPPDLLDDAPTQGTLVTFSHSGIEVHFDDPEHLDPPASGKALLCCPRPATAVTLVL